MRILEILNEKYLVNLKGYNHYSLNKHFYGYSEKLNIKIFIKYFRRKDKYYNEILLLKFLKSYMLLDYFIYEDYYIICYKYIDMQEVVKNDKNSLYNYGKLIGDFHKKATENLTNEVVKVNLFNEIHRKMNKIVSINEFDRIKEIYNNLQKYKNDYELEYNNLPKKVLHGDFGFRNIKLIDGKLELIDFEFVKEHIAYYEFIKFFKQNNLNNEDKSSFINGYNSVYKLEIPSELLIKVIEFDIALGIYSYTMKIDDKKFRKEADEIIDDIGKFLKYKIN